MNNVYKPEHKRYEKKAVNGRQKRENITRKIWLALIEFSVNSTFPTLC